ncbi:hypothetical protein EVJ50_03865 [Synechococcus sp. RSCCF101]|uniref:hypothetical protein n=1 Tax=Synechococcus sp. RSCCF101 TaxID=2511069 RepID=UPI0012491AB9|nr:hypothetical protein [Synechococcus sp. RSCCF101]QEY31513.1 hypothetical protein EVJ50_03865 [Synechococcus sp. RSCCF101]
MVRAEVADCWGVAQLRGRCRITLTWPDGSRSTVMAPIAWSPANASTILQLVGQLHEGIHQGLDLKDALARADLPATGAATPVRPSGIDWAALVEGFHSHKVGTGQVAERTWANIYRAPMALLCQAAAGRPKPATGKALLERVARLHGGAPGSRGRQQAIQTAAALLRWAVEEEGLPGVWAPPASLAKIVGQSQTPPALTVPLADGDLVSLVRGLSDPKLRLWLGLQGCFGLRPWEVYCCRPTSDGRLEVLKGKRNSRGYTPTRLITGLDPHLAEGMSADLLAQLRERGAEGLPRVTDPNNPSQTTRHLLNREPLWCAIRERYVAEGNALKPYGARHGFALRAHQLYELSPRVAASLMGHSPATHLSVYGRWVDDSTVADAIARARKRLSSTEVPDLA